MLAAATMSNDEFEVLRQDWERRLDEQITDQESSAQTKMSWLPHWRLPSTQLQREQRGVLRGV